MVLNNPLITKVMFFFLRHMTSVEFLFCFRMAMTVHSNTQLLQQALAPIINSAVPATLHHYSMGQAIPSTTYRECDKMTAALRRAVSHCFFNSQNFILLLLHLLFCQQPLFQLTYILWHLEQATQCKRQPLQVSYSLSQYCALNHSQ